ncbi:MAG: DUF1801 domain-containing protein [Alphaproteobacteria bacterium]|nr:DUF1801 domain-containing protein [Alphaproteobacteria bacterium]
MATKKTAAARPKAKPAKAAPAKPANKPKAAPAGRLKVSKGEKIPAGQTASQLIDQRIRDAGGWRGETFARVRALIHDAEPAIAEEWKWGVPVWSRHGIVCTGEVYTKVVKLTFAQGAKVPDPSGLFNSSLEGATRRAIDVREGETVDARAFKALVRAAVAHNAATKGR